jgi:hypothetical protein
MAINRQSETETERQDRRQRAAQAMVSTASLRRTRKRKTGGLEILSQEKGKHQCIPYSRKIWRGIKFGGLADQPANRQIKIFQY